MKKSRQLKKIKQNKSRKFKGGSIDTNSGYVLAGFTHDVMIPQVPSTIYIRNPIFFVNEKTLKTEIPHGANNNVRFFIPVLYNLNFRGINLAETFSNLFFSDGEEFIYPSSSGYTLKIRDNKYVLAMSQNGEIIFDESKDEKLKIKKIELKYPGLFTRMFITEKEQRDALARVEDEERRRKEEEDKFTNFLLSIN